MYKRQVFNVKSDYTGLEIKDDNKVKVTFEEAKNVKDEDFTTDHADTYKAVYYVEPVNQEDVYKRQGLYRDSCIFIIQDRKP